MHVLAWNLDTLDLSNNVDDRYTIEWRTEIKIRWPSQKHGWDRIPSPPEFSAGYSIVTLLIYRSAASAALASFSGIPRVSDSKALQWIKVRAQMLKSNCQKAARLSEVGKALRTTTLVLSTRDSALIEPLLKRWCIILAEDVMLHPVFSYLVFFQLLLSKGWTLNAEAEQIILKGLECALQPDVPADWRCDYNIPTSSSNSSSTFIEFALQAIVFRTSFGGMHGDMELLASLYTQWQLRLKSNLIPLQWQKWENQRWWSKDSAVQTKPLLFSSQDCLLTAVDHHCSSILPILIERCRLETSCSGLLSNLIWDYRSSLRIRPCSCGVHPNNEIISPKPVAVAPPEWWIKKVVPVIDDVCLQEWRQPSKDAAATRGKHSRSEILAAQIKQLDENRQVPESKKPRTNSMLSYFPRESKEQKT